jgi:integrase
LSGDVSGALDDEHQLLWRLLAETGMRLSEAFQVREEFAETHKGKRVRYVKRQ